ncbi:MAG: long-chain fatty acid--CoA ligase [Bacteroidales bacterium]|nr:long-chain fatty acid--CoA ligase [Bacteroidales bacterium]
MEHFRRDDALGGYEHGQWYTFSTAEYADNSRFFALGMLSLGLPRQAKVATITNNRPEWNFADMGMAMAGLVHVPIYPTISPEEYQYILENAEVKCLLAGDRKLVARLKPLVEKLPEFIGIYCFDKIDECPSVQDIIDAGKANADALAAELDSIMTAVSPDDVASLIYTSGTTGVPKGVMLTHRNLVSNFTAHVEMQDLGYGHRALSFLPLCHVYERSMNYHFQYKGMGVYYVPSLGQIVSAIREVKPHMFNSVPRLLERIYDGFISKGNDLHGLKRAIYFWAIRISRHFDYLHPLNFFRRLQWRVADRLVYSKWREALGNQVRYIVSGGAALQPRILRLFGMAGITAIEGYGLTETSPVIAVNNPVKGMIKIGSVGPVLPGVEVKIADDGEILCKGPCVMKGYYKAPELTAQVIDSDGWFHTGDIGELDDGVYLRITDRKKEIFKLSAGKYIAPQMIENKLKESFFIEQAMVIGENEKFASALISPNFDYLHEWCTEQRIFYYDNSELIRDKDVLQLYASEVNLINKTLGQHEEIKRFRLVEEEWSPHTGELSPTLKLKRQLLLDKYKDIIDEIYSVQKNTPQHPVSNGALIKLPRINLRFDIGRKMRKK